eukprot:365742-Chlamydomonas_euryale.AAC.10
MASWFNSPLEILVQDLGSRSWFKILVEEDPKALKQTPISYQCAPKESSRCVVTPPRPSGRLCGSGCPSK